MCCLGKTLSIPSITLNTSLTLLFYYRYSQYLSKLPHHHHSQFPTTISYSQSSISFNISLTIITLNTSPTTFTLITRNTSLIPNTYFFLPLNTTITIMVLLTVLVREGYIKNYPMKQLESYFTGINCVGGGGGVELYRGGSRRKKKRRGLGNSRLQRPFD